MWDALLKVLDELILLLSFSWNIKQRNEIRKLEQTLSVVEKTQEIKSRNHSLTDVELDSLL
jgi:hypothetical protein